MTDITFVLGTRPEAIKLAPVAHALKSFPQLSSKIVLTGQHREMTNGILDWFGLTPDIDLDIMVKGQSLAGITSRCVTKLDEYFSANPTKIVLAQGDTTSAFVASLVSFYHKVKVGHVEAGLRTANKYSPWPEEMNRRLVTQLADYHFAPTESNVQNLLKECVAAQNVLMCGNTVIDALLYSRDKVKSQNLYPENLQEFFVGSKKSSRIVLITGHRRENFGGGFENICNAIRTLAIRYPEVHFIYPVHLNPNVRTTVFEMLGSQKNILLTEPLQYPEFISMMERSYMILTDSGGVQEEAPSLKKPVLVFRENTERPEAVEAGMVMIVGNKTDKIIQSFISVYENDALYQSMIKGVNPYGDGLASTRIIQFISKNL